MKDVRAGGDEARGAGTDDALTDDALTGAFRILQLRRGHRYSVDDVCTAWEATQARPDAARFADLGCGIGSVLLMVAYKLASAVGVGIEAQAVSHQLCVRNVERNAVGDRVSVVRGDLRTSGLLDLLGGERFELVTGTPPYLPPGTAPESPTSSQRNHARLELRGGVEDYAAAAAQLLSPTGRFVVCMAARDDARVLDGATRAGLAALSRRAVIPRAGKPALFAVWVLAPRSRDLPALAEVAPLVMRDEDGQRAAGDREVRGWFGLGGARPGRPAPGSIPADHPGLPPPQATLGHRRPRARK